MKHSQSLTALLTMTLPLAMTLGGCSLTPRYERPALPVPQSWQHSETEPTEATAHPAAPAAARLPWHDYFDGSGLVPVIELALANNRDLEVAALSVDRARAMYRVQRADRVPHLSAGTTADISRLPERLSATGSAETVEQYSVNLGMASWEIDLFGRLRSLEESALEQYLATDEARRATQISLVAEVASVYLTLAADMESLEIAQATRVTQQASYELIRQSREHGMANDLDLRQAQSQVEAARADQARLAGQVALDQNALSLLVGAQVPESLLPSQLGIATRMPALAPGLPSDLLLSRPDIRLAEHQLRSANANIGAARAAFFPRISLTATGGTLSAELSRLFDSGSGTWRFAPGVSLPIFNAGALRAGLESALIERDMAVSRYEQAVQTAFREVNDALSLRTNLASQLEARRSLVEALEEAQRLAQVRYEAGIDSYLGVLVAQQSLYSARQALVAVRLAEQTNLVTMFKVLGGGAGDHQAGPARSPEPDEARDQPEPRP